jgi:hypothetical protein
MYKLLAAAALILTPNVAHAEVWVLVIVTEHAAAALLVDADSIAPAGGSVRRARVLGVTREDDDGLAGALAEMSFDCDGRRQRFDASWMYDATGKPGPREPSSAWEEAGEGTNYERVMQVVCGQVPLDGKRFGAGVPIAATREMLETRFIQDKAGN